MTDQLFDTNAEKALLGSILINPELISEAIDTPSEYFHSERHAAIFNAMRDIYRRGDAPDFVATAAELENSGRFANVGGYQYLAEITNDTPSHTNFYVYLQRVTDLGQRRVFVDAAAKAAQKAFDTSTPLTEALSALSTPQSSTASSWFSQALSPQELTAPPTPTEWIVESYVARNTLNIWYGVPGGKKSFILADLATCAANGIPWLNTILVDDETKPAQGLHTSTSKILWLDLDNGRKLTAKRFSALLSAHNSLPDNIIAVSMPSPWPFMDRDEPAQLLFDTISQNEIDLVIIDNLGHITGEVDENSSDMAKVMSRLRRIVDASGSSIIVIHHARKSINGRLGDNLRGSSSVEASLDSAFFIEPDEDDKSSSTIRPTKIRDGLWPKPLTVSGVFINDDSDPASTLLISASFHQSASPSFSRSDAIILALLKAVQSHGSQGTTSVIKEIQNSWDFDDKNISNSTLMKYITQAKSDNLITSRKDGRTKTLHLTRKGLDIIMLSEA